MQKTEAYIVAALRTPVGRYGGILKDVRPDDMSALVIRKFIERIKIAPEDVNDVLWGCANQAGEDNRNVGRMALLLAGFPHTVPGTTINRLCGSSLDAINQAARAIWSADYDIVIAGGVESMTRAPYVFPKNVSGKALYGNLTAYDTALGWRFPNPEMKSAIGGPLESMGETAENIAEKYKITREEQDTLALESHRRAIKTQDESHFNDEIIPVTIPQKEGNPILVEYDEGPRRDTSLEKLAQLPPVFRKNGTVTAGNSSSLNDGAAGVLIVSEKALKEYDLTPIAKIIATGVAGVDPRFMGLGPVPATKIALKKIGKSIDQIDLVELNEAFAAQTIAVVHDLELDLERTNVNGCAISIGHPLGCSGARIMTTLVHEMKRRKVTLGLATMCIGVGQGIATVVERIQ